MKKIEKRLPQEVLKLIACVTMLIDHFGATVLLQLPLTNLVSAYYTCRIIGRIAFPIYAFLLVEGMRRTRNPGKYILRMGYGILLAEIPFDILFFGGFSWEHQSVMFTLFLGAVMLLCLQKIGKDILKLLAVVPFAIAAEWICCDYGAWGIVMIAAFALADQLWLQALCVLVINWLMPTISIPFLRWEISIQLFGTLAMVPIALYSGRKITRNRKVQMGFYLFYPVHMLILWLIVLVLR